MLQQNHEKIECYKWYVKESFRYNLAKKFTILYHVVQVYFTNMFMPTKDEENWLKFYKNWDQNKVLKTNICSHVLQKIKKTQWTNMQITTLYQDMVLVLFMKNS